MNDGGGVEKAVKRRTPTLPSVRSRADRGSSLDRLVSRIDAARGDTAIGAGHRAGALVRTMRVESGLSQLALAEALGVSQARVSEIEAGEGPHGPTWDLMERVAAACGRGIGLLPLADPSFVTAGDMEVHYGRVSTLGGREGYVDVLGPDYPLGLNLRYQGVQVRVEEAGSGPDLDLRYGGHGSLGEARITRPEGRGGDRRRSLGKPA